MARRRGRAKSPPPAHEPPADPRQLSIGDAAGPPTLQVLPHELPVGDVSRDSGGVEWTVRTAPRTYLNGHRVEANRWGFGRQIARDRADRDWRHHRVTPGQQFTVGPSVSDGKSDGIVWRYRVTRAFYIKFIQTETEEARLIETAEQRNKCVRLEIEQRMAARSWKHNAPGRAATRPRAGPQPITPRTEKRRWPPTVYPAATCSCARTWRRRPGGRSSPSYSGRDRPMARTIKRTWTSRGPTGHRVKHVAYGFTVQVDGKQERRSSSAWTDRGLPVPRPAPHLRFLAGDARPPAEGDPGASRAPRLQDDPPLHAPESWAAPRCRRVP